MVSSRLAQGSNHSFVLWAIGEMLRWKICVCYFIFFLLMLNSALALPPLSEQHKLPLNVKRSGQDKPAYVTDPILVDLNVGESQPLHIPGSRSHSLQLISYKEFTVPYYSSVVGETVPAINSAVVKLRVDGKMVRLDGGPYRMPTRVADLDMMLILTRHWTEGFSPDFLAKDIRLEIQSSSVPWINHGRLYFPIRNYRWRASNYQHTYLALAVNQAKIYYHRGEDLGMMPDLAQALAITGGLVTKVPGPTGDNASNSLIFESGTLVFRYAHMNTPNIRPELRPGVLVKAGEVLGLTGNTWRGRPVRDPHLHIQVKDIARDIYHASFPIMVSAYRETFPDEVLPIAGSPYHCYAGEAVNLDGKFSLPSLHSHLIRWQWKFTDGTSANGPVVRRRYKEPGEYSEQLIVTDAAGHTDSDFAEVFVLSKEQRQPPPYIWINYYPIRPILPAEPVRFLIRYAHVQKPEIDFGDGTKTMWTEMSQHTYFRPGTYVVTVRGANAGSGPGIFKVRVVVERRG